jgi:ABC-2 type transport system permease protein
VTRAFFRTLFATLEANRKAAFRDPRLVVAGLLIPLLILGLVGLIFSRSTKIPVGIVKNDDGPIARQLVYTIGRSPEVSLRSYGNAHDLKDDVLRGRIVAGIIIPKSMSSTVLSGRQSAVTLVAPIGSQDGAIARSYLTEAVALAGSGVVTGQVAGGLETREGVAAYRAASDVTARLFKMLARSQAKHEGNPYTYLTAGQAVMFGFITVMGASTLMVEMRRNGLYRRILATPVPASALVVSQFISMLTLGVGQVVALLAIGKLLFHVPLGDPGGTALVVVAVALAAAGAAAVVGSLAKSPEQALTVTTVAGIAAAMLGGCIWPLSIVGQGMRLVGHVTPQAWAMDALVGLMTGGKSLAGIVPDAAVLLAFGSVLVVAAALSFRRVIAR